MRLTLVCATFVAGPLSIFALALPAGAQQGPPPGGARPPVTPAATAPAVAPAPSGTSVVVIDVAYVFKNHVRFNAKMNDIKRDIEQYDAYVKAETGKMNTKREELANFKPNTPDYKTREEELAHMQSDLQIKVGLKRKEFLEQEAREYFNTYREIEQTVAVFAQRHRISLVLRFNGDEMKPDDRASVLAGVNRAVVYQQGLDITELILRELNPAGATVPAGPSTNPLPPGTPTAPNRPVVPRSGNPVLK